MIRRYIPASVRRGSKPAILAMLSVAGYFRWRRRRLPGARAVILCYHHVTDNLQAADGHWAPFQRGVSQARFDRQMRFLREAMTPVSLQDVVASIQAKKLLPPRAVAVTFDDGYRDNFTVGYPILKRYEIPATVFVTSGFIDGNELFWWDQVYSTLRDTRAPAVDLNLIMQSARRMCQRAAGSGQQAEYRASDRQHLTPKTRYLNTDNRPLTTDYQTAERTWQQAASSWQSTGCKEENAGGKRQGAKRKVQGADLYKLTTYAERVRAAEAVIDLLRSAPQTGRDASLQRLRVALGLGPNAALRGPGMMTWEQVREMSRNGIAVESHTHTHPILGLTDPEAVERELKTSKELIEKQTGRAVHGLAYPDGRHRTYTEATMAIAKEAGFSFGCTAERRRVGPEAGLFSLGRLPVGNVSLPEFQLELMRAFAAE